MFSKIGAGRRELIGRRWAVHLSDFDVIVRRRRRCGHRSATNDSVCVVVVVVPSNPTGAARAVVSARVVRRRDASFVFMSDMKCVREGLRD